MAAKNNCCCCFCCCYSFYCFDTGLLCCCCRCCHTCFERQYSRLNIQSRNFPPPPSLVENFIRIYPSVWATALPHTHTHTQPQRRTHIHTHTLGSIATYSVEMTEYKNMLTNHNIMTTHQIFVLLNLSNVSNCPVIVFSLIS